MKDAFRQPPDAQMQCYRPAFATKNVNQRRKKVWKRSGDEFRMLNSFIKKYQLALKLKRSASGKLAYNGNAFALRRRKN